MKSENDFNKDKAIRDIIQKFNTIENLVKEIIIRHIKPTENKHTNWRKNR